MTVCRRLLLAVLVAVLLGCGPDPGTRQDRITVDQLDTGHPAVGLLIFSLSGSTRQDGACTAILVGSDLVLTAAHCASYPNTAFTVVGKTYASTANIAHPSYDHDTSPYLYDLALIRLAAAPPVEPMPLAPAAPTVGETITLVGFGRTSDDVKDNGVKRFAQNTIDTVAPYHFELSGTGNGEGNACYGDSGGPVLVGEAGKESIRGLLSYIDGSCGPSTTMASRLDVFLPWLRSRGGDVLVVRDTVRPVVKIDRPVEGTLVVGPLELEIIASDDLGVSRVEVRVDGATSSALSAPPYRASLTLAAGSHRLEGVAFDAAGNSATAAVTVRVAGDETHAPVEGCGLAASSAGGASLPVLLLFALLVVVTSFPMVHVRYGPEKEHSRTKFAGAWRAADTPFAKEAHPTVVAEE